MTERQRALERELAETKAALTRALRAEAEALEDDAEATVFLLTEFALWISPVWDRRYEDDRDSARRAVEAFLASGPQSVTPLNDAEAPDDK